MSAAFDNVDSDRHSLWVQHADTHAQSNTPAARGLTVRRSPSIGRAESAPRTRLEGIARSRRSSRPLLRSDSTSPTGRIRPIGRRVGDFQPPTRQHRGPLARSSGRKPGRLARSSGRSGGRLGAGRRSTRRGESTAARSTRRVGFDRRHYLCRRHFLCRPFLAGQNFLLCGCNAAIFY